jgi:ubiquitin-like 1-activating enzyme E1 B
MCLAADVPLIESGTMGFNGQVQVIKMGKTECYDCNPKETPKSFPVCTIRSTPSQSIHCIVWAKSYLLPELFGVSEDETPELDTSTNEGNMEEIENLRREAQALKRIRESMGSDSFAKDVFDKVFKEDIERLRGMEDMWKTRQPPQPLQYDSLQQEATTIDTTVSAFDQHVWQLAENFTVFKDSLQRLSKRLQDEQAAAMKDGFLKPIIAFDKDDEDTLDFVTASANLRSAIFGIETKSKFDIKQMAGNIIPAVATTNAMTAGLCVLQAFKVMRGDYFGAKSAKMVYLERGGPRAMNSESLRPPNPDCTVCGIATSRLEVDPTRATLKDLVEDILRLQLGYGEELTINNEIGTVYDPDLDDNLSKKFEDLGIKNESFLTVIDDEADNPRVNLQFTISLKVLPENEKSVVLVTKPDIGRRPRKPVVESTREATTGTADQMINGTSTAKRKRGADDADLEGNTPVKKAQATVPVNDVADAIVLEDKEDGAIVIDDE